MSEWGEQVASVLRTRRQQQPHYFTNTHTQLHTHNITTSPPTPHTPTPRHTACHHCISITRGSEDLFLIQSVSAGVTSPRSPAFSLPLPLPPPRSPLHPSLHSRWCVSGIVGLVDAGVRFVCQFMHVCWRDCVCVCVCACVCVCVCVCVFVCSSNPVGNTLSFRLSESQHFWGVILAWPCFLRGPGGFFSSRYYVEYFQNTSNNFCINLFCSSWHPKSNFHFPFSSVFGLHQLTGKLSGPLAAKCSSGLT